MGKLERERERERNILLEFLILEFFVWVCQRCCYNLLLSLLLYYHLYFDFSICDFCLFIFVRTFLFLPSQMVRSAAELSKKSLEPNLAEFKRFHATRKVRTVRTLRMYSDNFLIFFYYELNFHELIWKFYIILYIWIK